MLFSCQQVKWSKLSSIQWYAARCMEASAAFLAFWKCLDAALGAWKNWGREGDLDMELELVNLLFLYELHKEGHLVLQGRNLRSHPQLTGLMEQV